MMGQQHHGGDLAQDGAMSERHAWETGTYTYVFSFSLCNLNHGILGLACNGRGSFCVPMILFIWIDIPSQLLQLNLQYSISNYS